MHKHPRPEVMHKQIPAHRERITDFLGLGAKDVAVEQAQVGPLIERRSDLVQHLSLDQQTKPAEPFCVNVVALLRRPASALDPSGLQEVVFPFRQAGDEVILDNNAVNIQGIAGNVRVYKEVTWETTTATRFRGFQLEFIVNKAPDGMTAPAAKFHWMQFFTSYAEDRNGSAIAPFIYSSNGFFRKAEKDTYYLDTTSTLASAYYDVIGSNRRTANEISIWDRPDPFTPATIPAADLNNVAKSIDRFQTYLVMDDGAGNVSVLFHVEWERVQLWADWAHKGAPFYNNISSKPVLPLPAFAQGNQLLAGYFGRRTNLTRATVVNPIPAGSRNPRLPAPPPRDGVGIKIRIPRLLEGYPSLGGGFVP